MSTPLNEFDAAWAEFRAAAAKADGRPIAGLFNGDPDRVAEFSLEAAGLYMDLSKQPWSRSDLAAGLTLARAAGVDAARDHLFSGKPVNRSEARAALHPALRAPDGAQFFADGEAVSPQISQTRAAMRAFAEQVRLGEAVGATGRPFTAVVHIGIGGSDLGPRVVWEALRPTDLTMRLRFVANVDPADLGLALSGLNPAETLVVIVSKTFTTQETLANAETARRWLREAVGEDVSRHLVAVTASPERSSAFGVPADRTFAFGDWVGGRYSVWSAVGLSCAIALGFDVFERLLAGGYAMDRHFCEAPLERSAPVLLALAHVFNRNGLGRGARAVVPYAQRLRLFASMLQQIEMESNGKQVDREGRPVQEATCGVVFGDAGTNGQHAFFQFLHQGVDVVPVDFIAVREGREQDPAAQRKLLANAIAQAEALLNGRSEAEVRKELAERGHTPEQIDELAPQRTFPGNRPSSFIVMERLEAEELGALIALYEHKTFCEGVLWGINSFDQWGVELGKTLAARVLEDLDGGAHPHDPSTQALIERLR